MNAFERETVINSSDGDDRVLIWTSQRRFITKLRRHPRVTQIRTGYVGESEWAEFLVPSGQWNPCASTLSESQKRAVAERSALRDAQVIVP